MPKLLEVRYTRRWFFFGSERAHIWDGRRWVKLSKAQTERQHKFDRLHADNERLLNGLAAWSA